MIDIHTHIFPKSVRQQRSDYYQSEPNFGELYGSPNSQMIGADQLIAALDENQIARAVTFGFPWRNPETSRRHNDYILDAVSRYPHRLIGFGCLDPLAPDAPAEVQRCLASGLSGIGELAFYDSDIDERCIEALAPIMDICYQFDRPVMLHTNEPIGHHYPGKSPNTLAGIYHFIRRFSENRIILAHWGGGILFYRLLKKEVPQAMTNVWFDTAASPYLYRPALYRMAMDILEPEKVLFGTDFPLLSHSRYLKEMDQAGLTDQEKQMICHDNAAALLKLN